MINKKTTILDLSKVSLIKGRLKEVEAEFERKINSEF